jgi:hypothetical protein
MGDKSPKSTQRGKDQKNAAKTQARSDKDKRQQAFSSVLPKGTKR